MCTVCLDVLSDQLEQLDMLIARALTKSLLLKDTVDTGHLAAALLGGGIAREGN